LDGLLTVVLPRAAAFGAGDVCRLGLALLVLAIVLLGPFQALALLLGVLDLLAAGDWVVRHDSCWPDQVDRDGEAREQATEDRPARSERASQRIESPVVHELLPMLSCTRSHSR
jgi:hypothetical protein